MPIAEIQARKLWPSFHTDPPDRAPEHRLRRAMLLRAHCIGLSIFRAQCPRYTDR